MIGAFFAILKIAGLLILLIFGILFLLAVLVLFWPVKYAVDVKYSNTQLDYEVKISWLAKLILFYTLKNSESEKTQFRIAWLKIVNSDKNYEEEIPDKKVIEKKESALEENARKQAEPIKTDTSSNTEQDEEETKKDYSEEIEDAKGDKISGLKDLFNKVKEVYNYPDRDEIFKAVIILIKRLFKALKPKYLHLDCEFGFDTPDTTGTALAIVGIIKTMIYKDTFDIRLKGNFNEKMLSIDAGLNGKIVLWSGLWPLVAFIFKKPIWKIISAKLFNKNNSEGDK